MVGLSKESNCAPGNTTSIRKANKRIVSRAKGSLLMKRMLDLFDALRASSKLTLQPAFNFLTGNAHIRNSTAATAASPPAKKNAVAAL